MWCNVTAAGHPITHLIARGVPGVVFLVPPCGGPMMPKKVAALVCAWGDRAAAAAPCSTADVLEWGRRAVGRLAAMPAQHSYKGGGATALLAAAAAHQQDNVASACLPAGWWCVCIGLCRGQGPTPGLPRTCCTGAMR
jgi:hypothetical protein